jgi:hypothetical protein
MHPSALDIVDFELDIRGGPELVPISRGSRRKPNGKGGGCRTRLAGWG